MFYLDLSSFYSILQHSINSGNQKYFFQSLNSSLLSLDYLNKGVDVEVILGLNVSNSELLAIKIDLTSSDLLKNPFQNECKILEKIKGNSGIQELICEGKMDDGC